MRGHFFISLFGRHLYFRLQLDETKNTSVRYKRYSHSRNDGDSQGQLAFLAYERVDEISRDEFRLPEKSCTMIRLGYRRCIVNNFRFHSCNVLRVRRDPPIFGVRVDIPGK